MFYLINYLLVYNISNNMYVQLVFNSIDSDYKPNNNT